MKNIKTSVIKTCGRRLLSFVLVTALMLGLIPESAYAAGTQSRPAGEAVYTSGDCDITYKETNTWGNYVNVDVTITNNGDGTIDPWKLLLQYDGTISNIWNADMEASGEGEYRIAAKSYNAKLEAGKSVSFGFTACGETEKPEVPLGISMEGAASGTTEEKTSEEITAGQKNTEQETESTTQEESTGKGETEKPADGTTQNEGSYTIPEKWKGLNYALFTSGGETLSLYTNETSIYGDVHSNKDFYYQGTSIKVDGTLEAAGSIDLKTASGADCQQVGRQQEKAGSLEMPDITKEISAYCKEKGTVYDGTTDFNSDSIVVDKPVLIEGSANFNATSFLGKGIVYAEDSVTCNVGTLATPEDSRVFLAAGNGNITLNGSDIALNAVLYAPNGCVSINANHVTLNGRIIAKQVRINGTLINIQTGPYDLDMLDFLFKPEMELSFAGNKKENRKVTIDVEGISDTESIIREDTVWSITRDGSEVKDACAVDEEASDAFHKEMIFREAGTYGVSVTVTTGGVDYTVTKELVIEKDLAPVAAFSLEQGYYSRDEQGHAGIAVKDASSSPDGDAIGQRIWTVYYDADNNGEFTEQEASVYSDGNETEPVIDTDKVGKYKVVLTAVETFTDTIPKLLAEDAYLRDDTSEYAVQACVFEVGNEAPEARLSVEKSKSADIVFTLGDADKETMDTYNAKAEELKKILKEKGVDARIDAVATSTLTAQDTFAWKEYDHYNYRDKFDITLEKHILYEGTDIRMVGYAEYSFNDFLYVPDEDAGTKVFEFDLQKDATDWHSMEGGGFLFNTSIREEENEIQGFCILFTQTGLKLIKIDCNRFTSFRGCVYRWLQDAGKLLQTFPVDNLYDNHHFKIVVDSRTISVWDGEKLVIDNFILPENDYGYGFGPIVSHKQHFCEQQSYFTFKNITMRTMTGSTLSDIVAGYGWRPGASHYVISLSETGVPELSSGEETAELAAALIENGAAFVGIGNESNENQYQSLLNATETGGMYTETGEIGTTMDKVNAFLASDILSKDYSVGEYLTTDDIISYGGYYRDAENDEIYEQQWEYEYDPSVFGETAGETEHIVRKESEPLTTFTETGAYAIRLNIRDNPAGDNDALDSYRLWSGTDEYEKLVVVQSRPVASVKAEVSGNPSDKTTCIVHTTYEGSDADHPGDAAKGIREEYYAYKNVKDGEWTEGKMPNRVTVGETYLVKYRVKDVEGSWSFPAVAVVKTRDLLSYQETEDTTPPEIFIETSKTEAKAGEELRIEGWALDDYGMDSFTMSINGEKVLDTFGRVCYTPDGAGTITVKAVAVDIGGNRSEKELTIPVTDDRDKTAPEAVITSPSAGSELDFNVQIKGTAKDETKLAKYTLSYKEERDTEYTVFKESGTPVSDDILGTLDISDFADGTYEILLAAEDAAGNVSYYGIILYIETGVTRGYRLKAEITGVKYNEETDAVDIYGTVSGEGHLKGYSLAYQYQAEELKDMVTVSEGTEEITEGLLGSIRTEDLVPGTYSLTLSITGTEGNSGAACGAFTYTEETEEGEGEEGRPQLSMDLNAPEAEITGLKLSDDHGYVEIRGTVKDDKELKGWLLDFAKEESGEYTELASGTEEAEDAPLANISAETLEDGGYILRLTAWDAYGNHVLYTTGFTYQKGSGKLETGGGSSEESPAPTEPVKKNFAVNLSHSAADIGTEVQVQVTLPDNVKEESLQIKQGDKVISEGSRKAAFTSDKAGTVTITVTGVTEEGETLTAEARCTFYKLTDKNPPTAAITSPTIDTVLTEPVDFVGSAYDAEGLDFWKLEYRMAGEEEYMLLNEGTEPVKDGVLGHLDTTMLMNGQYNVRLTVQDEGGNTRRLENDYVVEGELKVGAMNVGFTDIDCLVTGIPLQVQRNYSSKNKTKGDFGIGWNMGMNDMQLRVMNDFCEGWEMNKSGSLFSTGYTLSETMSHDVVITYGDGSSDRFEVVLNKNYQAYIPIYETKIEFKCVTNQKLKLAINGNNQYSTSGVLGENYLIGDDFEQMENPQNYILTLEDGTKVYLNIKNGIQKMEDTRGNTVTVTKDGYEHSEGKGITFKRDSEGRVVKATDSNGDYKEYAYDKDGNLASVTDRAGRIVSYGYDKEHNLISITDPTGAAIARNEYDEDGRLTAIIDADGNRTEYDYDIDSKIQIVKDVLGGSTVYSYDNNGNILSKTDALGHKTSYTYDNSNNVLSETDALNRTTTYAYDSKGNRTQTTLPDGTVAKSSYNSTNHVTSIQSAQKTFMDIEYDEFGDATSVENGNGDITSYSYNDKGQLRSITDGIGEYTRFSYDASGNIKAMINGNGDRTDFVYDESRNCISKTVTETVNGTEQTYTVKFEYDKAGNVIKSIDPENGITSYEYDENGNKNATVDANGNRTAFAYDSNGNLETVQYADGTSEHFTYDAAGNNLTATSRTGQTVTMEYDKLSQMTKMADATGYTIEYKYDACGNLTETVTSEGAKTQYAYDDRNRNISVTDTYGNTTTYTYTETSQVETITDALGHVTEFQYDDCDNCIKVTYADGSSVSSEYDERGRLVGQKDQMGYKMSYRYDGGDHLTGVTDAEGNETVYEYNNAGELVSVTDALNHTTSYEYDGNSRLIKTINAAGQTAENAYDMAGNLISQTAWDGTKTTYSYDDYGCLIKKAAGQKSTSYVYDDMSRLIEVKDSTGTIQYAYDKYGRLVSRTDTNNKKVAYTYDKAGRTAAVDTPYGKTAYEYDLLDRVTKVIDRNGEATLYEYDELGNRTAVRYPNGAAVTYTYDACNRLKEEWLSEGENKIPCGYRYTTDKEGKRTRIEEIQADGSTFITEYEYDKLDRLTKESLAYGKNRITSSYTYDAASNRLSKNTVITGDVEELADVSSGIASSVAEGKTEYTYNELNQLVNEAGPDAVHQYIYDKNGNLVKETSSRAGDRQSELSYDEENHLVLATQQIGNEVTITRYTYDGEGNRIASQTNEQDAVYYVNDTSGLSMVLAETDGNGREKAFYTIGQERISLSRDGKVWYYGYDGHGDTRLLIDEEGTVTDTYRYDAWGNMLSKTGSTSNTYLYTGESFDANTGLYYLRARYMNPANGLFISMDSYQGNLYEPVTLHKYLYANANPVVYTDPTGYFSFSETQIAQTIQAELNSQVTLSFKTVMKMVNVASTSYSTTRRAVTSILEGDSAMSVMGEWLIGAISGALIGILLPIACVIPKPVMTVISVLLTVLIVPQVIEDWKNGDYDLAVAGGLQMLSSLSAIFMKCFTGDTLVATEDGDKRIDEIEVGDSVWAEDTVTGEQVLKRVSKVYVKETDHLIHIGTSTGEDIETTENHPFYTEERGWVAASELEEGETLHTEDGSVVTVTYNRDEWLREPVKVYNLEVEGLHTYYVTVDRVLVHNEYNVKSSIDKDPKLVKAAEKMGENQRVQQEANDLVNQFVNGNTNPGIGNKNLFGDVNYLRGKNGARVFFRNILDGIEILAKADKSNEESVIKLLIELYGKR